jgi:hypothetical protein
VKQIFLLSPARCGGKRGALLLNDRASFPLARSLRSPEGATLGEVMSFVSGLYFRGKLEYSRAFARPPDQMEGVLVITPNRGLVPADERIRLADFRKFVTIDIHPKESRFRRPLERDARRVAESAGVGCRTILLGSIATGKYVEVLGPAFPDGLRFPGDFVGRGDMSRGGLLLRCVLEGRELDYVPIEGTLRHGPKPPKLEPIRTALRRPARAAHES